MVTCNLETLSTLALLRYMLLHSPVLGILVICRHALLGCPHHTYPSRVCTAR